MTLPGSDSPRAASDGQAHIEVRDLTMAFGDFVLMRDLNFRIARGDVFVIMGALDAAVLLVTGICRYAYRARRTAGGLWSRA